MIEREEGVTYIATISGGKDSVTMCDLLIRKGYPVDYVVFNDTLDEFKEMYKYLDKVEDYFKQRYKRTITRLKPLKDYDRDYIFGVISDKRDAKFAGMTRGLPSANMSFCGWRRDSKIVPFEKWKKQFAKTKTYIGITMDETHRANREDDNFLYPLIDNFKMSERDCKKYLIDRDMENPLYRHFNRTGCAKCQYQSEDSWFKVWKYYPEVWAEVKDYEAKINKLDNVVGTHWFTKYRTCTDMEANFMQADKQGSLFDFSDEPLKDCFCKI